MPDSSTQIMGTNPGMEIGNTLGSYQLVRLLGKGAMGKVFHARHVLLGREVAIKVLNPEFVAQPDVVQRFFREARVVNEIDHEHIVEVTDFVEAPGLAYLVMELLEGTSLRDLSQARGSKYPNVKRLLGLMAQVCEALEAAHEKGVIHRDLKPDNVFVVERDGEDFVKVLDFGVAKLRDTSDHAATSAGMILGTPHYMAPEQALGREVDRRADVWAAGVVLYELLSGKVPFTAPSFVELAMQIREKPPEPLPRKTPRGERVPQWLAGVVATCLEKRPADRFKSMAALAEALRPPRRRAADGRLRWMAGAAAALLLASGGALLVARKAPSRAAAALSSALSSALASLRSRPDPAAPRAGPGPDERAAKDAQAALPASPPPSPPPAPARNATRTAAPEPARATAPPRPAGKTPAGAPAGDAKRRASAAPAHATVELDVRSSPAGASVTRLDTGKRLGKTPLRVHVPRKEATAWIELALQGYAPVKFTVDLRRDSSATVTLKGAKRKAQRGR